MKDEKYLFSIVAIVAIVAIVGVVVLISGSQSGNSIPELESYYSQDTKTSSYSTPSGMSVYESTSSHKPEPIILHRTTRNCEDHSVVREESSRDLSDGYSNYRCRSRYYEQCIQDGSFDTYYDEWCEYYENRDLSKATILHRTTRDCEDNSVVREESTINLSGGYSNYRCRSRYYEQCIQDGSFDTYYDEWCEYETEDEPKPDLELTKFELYRDSSSTVTRKICIENKGDADTGRFNIKYYNLDNPGHFMGGAGFNSFYPGQEYCSGTGSWWNVYYDGGNGFVDGINRIKLVVDSDNDVDEENENNNYKIFSFNTHDGLTGNCTDSDGGLAYYVKGHINGSMPENFISEDMCISPEGRLREVYCIDGYGSAKLYDCPNGCEDGACIKNQTQYNCTDSDGGKNYFEKGTTIYKNDGYTDRCRPNQYGELIKLTEYYCKEDILHAETIYCPNGCKDGVCIKDNTTCTDSDGGLAYYVKGHINGLMPENFISEDMCISPEGRLREVYCIDGYGSAKLYDCPYGCQNGACIRENETGRINFKYFRTDKDYYVQDHNPINFEGVFDLSKNISSSDLKGYLTISPLLEPNKIIVYTDFQFNCSLKSGKTTCYIIVEGPRIVSDLMVGVYEANAYVWASGFKKVIAITDFEIIKNQTQYNCTDSDGGKNYFEKGTTIYKNDGYTDRCRPNQYGELIKLTEYYCKEDILHAETIYCPNGCEDGACIRENQTQEGSQIPSDEPSDRGFFQNFLRIFFWRRG